MAPPPFAPATTTGRTFDPVQLSKNGLSRLRSKAGGGGSRSQSPSLAWGPGSDEGGEDTPIQNPHLLPLAERTSTLRRGKNWPLSRFAASRAANKAAGGADAGGMAGAGAHGFVGGLEVPLEELSFDYSEGDDDDYEDDLVFERRRGWELDRPKDEEELQRDRDELARKERFAAFFPHSFADKEPR